MFFDDGEDEVAFREEVRQFIRQNYPPSLRSEHPEGYDLDKASLLSWHRILAAKGWIAPRWPEQYGGAGWSEVQLYIWLEELARADTIPVFPLGIEMIGPVIYTFGTEAQKARFLPPTLSGEVWWCQGFSEPDAGSDLASLRTKAIRGTDDQGEHFVVTGQKIWTTMAQYADWGFFLVRTREDGKPQQGISLLLIEMTSPGVSIVPIATIDGYYEVNEVWLENVRVPVENRIHGENEGWTCAKFLLSNERTGFAEVARSKRALERLKAANLMPRDEAIRPADASLSRRMTELEVDLAALEAIERRMLGREDEKHGMEAAPSLLKIRGSEIQQQITELALEAASRAGSSTSGSDPGSVNRSRANYFNMRKTTIYGGSNEIQRNIIARLLLGA